MHGSFLNLRSLNGSQDTHENGAGNRKSGVP